MAQPRIDAVHLVRSIEELSKIGHLPSGGISRFTFSPSDMQAREYVSNLMENSGLRVRVDPFGNIIGHMKGVSDNRPAVMCGSHIDTVPNGGPLDGAYGVLSGIEAARTIHENGMHINNPLEVVVFTEEEGVRFPSFIGSLGFIGELRKANAYALKDNNGITFGRAIKAGGLGVLRVPHVYRGSHEIKAYLELHIEQGPVLDREMIPVGIVKTIVGLGDLKVHLSGAAGHAGTTPMALRHDALLGAARVISGVYKIGSRRRDAVATVGSLGVSPNASNVIPGKAEFTVDFRHPTRRGLAQLRSELINLVKHVGKEEHLRVQIEERGFTEPAQMSPRIMKTIKTAVRSLGLTHKQMASGAGHDCQNMARITPRVYLEAGANVLLNTLLRLLNE
jgi:hydantoinase/carbamoylase family amidase